MRFSLTQDLLNYLGQRYGPQSDEGGSCCVLWLWSKPVVVIFDEQVARRALLSGHRGTETWENQHFGGHDLFFAHGDRWVERRRLLHRFFGTKTFLPEYSLSLNSLIPRLLDRLDGKASCDITDVLAKFVFDLTGLGFFGQDFGCSCEEETVTSTGEKARKAFDRLSELYGVISSSVFPQWTSWRLREEVKVHLATLATTVDHLRLSRLSHGHFLAYLQARTDDGCISPIQLQQELQGFLFAGYDTITTTYPAIQDQLRRHLEQKEEKKRDEDADENEGGNELLDAFLRESQRHQSVAPLLVRQLTKPLITAKYEIPEGTEVWIASQWLHHDAHLFSEPFEFRLDRWQSSSASSSAFRPFGGGPRACLGQRYAKFAVKTVLQAILCQYSITLATPTASLLLTEQFIVMPMPTTLHLCFTRITL